MERRLRERELDNDETIKEMIEAATNEAEQAKTPDFYGKIFNNDFEETFKSIERYIFGNEAPDSPLSEMEEDAVEALAADIDMEAPKLGSEEAA